MAEQSRRLRLLLLIGLAHDTFWLELCVAVAAAGWGIYVWLMPGDLADHDAYTAAARFAPDEFWAVMGALGAAVQVAAATLHKRMARFIAAVAMTAFWLFCAPHAVSPGMVLYWCMAGSNALCAALPIIRRLPFLRAP